MEDENELLLGSEQLSNESFIKAMNDELNRDPNLSEEETEDLTNELLGMKDNYANGSNNDKASLERELVEKAQSMTMPEEFKKTLAGTLTDTGNFGHDPVEKLGPYAADIMGIVDESKPIIYKNKQPGYEMYDGEWMSFNAINDMLKGMKLDQASKGGLKILLDDVIAKSEQIQPGENAEFNYQKEYNNIKEKIVESGNIKSLTVDKMFGNRTFKDDLMSAIQKGTYEQMGITKDQIQDPTPEDGKITKEDAKVIYETITKDEKMLKEYLAEYFTKALEQNWNNNLSQEVRTKKDLESDIIEEEIEEDTENIEGKELPLYDVNVGLNLPPSISK